VEEDAEVAEEVDGAVAEEGVAAAGVVWAHAVADAVVALADVVVALAVARQVEDAVAVSVDAVAVSADARQVEDAVAVSEEDEDAGDTDRQSRFCLCRANSYG